MNALDPFSIPITGVELVDASAGTGKTHTIATLFLRLVLERSLPVDRILVVTFTKAATAELRDRIRKRLGEALQTFENGPGSDPTLARLYERTRHRDRARNKLAAAVASADQAAVLTIHGFCQRVLDEHAFESGARFDLSLLPDISPLVIEIVQDFWNRKLPGARPEVVEYVRRRRRFPELVRLALLAARNPEVPVIASASAGGLERALEAFREAREALIAEWRTGHRAATALLHGSSSLSRTQYSPKICARLIDEMEAFANSAQALDVPQDLFKLSARQLSSSVKRGGVAPRHAVFDRCEAMIDAWEESRSGLEAWAQAFERDLTAFVREELPARARARGILSFDDLLHEMHHALSGSNGEHLAATVRRRFPAAVIDEFHDTDPVQYGIFRRIYRGAKTSLFLIGDPKQAIYAFRGADVYAYLAATHDADHRFTLTTNHRSDPSVVRAVNGVFGRTEAPFVLEEIRFAPVVARPSATDELAMDGSPASGLEIVFVPRTDGDAGKSRRPSPEVVPGLVAREIAGLLASAATIRDRPLRAGDIAVLTRTNAEARDVQTELRALGVTGVLHGDSSVLDTDEADELAIVLRALADPGNPTAVRSALATSLLGQSAAELFELGEDESAWERWAASFGRWHDVWKTRGILAAARRMLSDERAAARLLEAPGGERRLTNFVHLVELLHKQAIEQHAGMAGLIAWFDDVRHKEDARGGVAPEAQQVRLESDEHAVQLTTMHRSKGLEYPVVYLPHLWKSAGLFAGDKKNLVYHDRFAGNRKVLDLRAEDQKQAELLVAEKESLAEAQRLTYVALTRAKHRAVVIWGAFRNLERSALARLLHPRVVDSADRASDADLLADLGELARDSGGSIIVRSHVPSGPAAATPPPNGPPLRARRVPTRRLSTRRTSSFTGLSSGADAPESPVDEARDVDDAPSTTAALDASGVGDRMSRKRVPLDDFPRGPRAGDALHGILERIDFERHEAAELSRIAAEQLALHGFAADLWSSPLALALEDVLRTPLDDREPGLSLSKISVDRRRAEMEFTFPVAVATRLSGRPPPLSANALASALRKRDGLPPGYADRVAALDFAPLAGFLRGFIDLVFEHDGRFYVVDYKSNHLGPFPDDYARAALEASMSAHHYYLQYHLYAVAVHRFLRARLSNYEYSRHFGGVFYLFVRGMAPTRGSHTGVFFDRPSEECLETLSAVLDGARPRARP
jgi:exodeoxyribonuclease V beta subunit